jgi:hypothetical protein
VIIAWVPFRAASFPAARSILAGMAGLLTLLGWEVAADTVAIGLLLVLLVLGGVFFANLRSRAR